MPDGANTIKGIAADALGKGCSQDKAEKSISRIDSIAANCG